MFADEYQVRGGVDLGIMSFSTDVEIGKRYSRSGIVLEARTGLVTRGASLQELSYYPFEREVCFPPCTALDVLEDFRVEGAAMMVTVALTRCCWPWSPMMTTALANSCAHSSTLVP